MKSAKIYIYLLAIAVLYIIFQQVNGNKKIKTDQATIEKLQSRIETKSALTDSLENEVIELGYFDLQYDEYAREYIEDIGLTVNTVESLILDTLIEANSSEKDNPYIPLAGLEGTTKVDRVKLLNHKWAIADFTDGTYWGQVLFLYQVDKNKNVNLEVITSHLYSKVK